MIESTDRVAEFKAEVSEMRLADPALARDRMLLKLAVTLLVVGPLLGLVGYLLSHGTTNPLQQRDAIVVALIGVSLSVVGGALYVRYSMAGFLRFWMARLTYEQKAQTDRMVDALEPPKAGSSVADRQLT
jgi:hypothetical protein